MPGYSDSTRLNNLGSASQAFAITPHATTPLSPTPRAIYVGTTGDITLKPRNSASDVVLVGVPAGTIIPLIVTHVRATGTTADDLVGLL